jgi:hypothetical protein
MRVSLYAGVLRGVFPDDGVQETVELVCASGMITAPFC